MGQTKDDPASEAGVLAEADRVQPLAADGVPELPCRDLGAGIATETVVCAAATGRNLKTLACHTGRSSLYEPTPSMHYIPIKLGEDT